MREFTGDIRLAARAWWSAPLLPVFSLAIALAQEVLVLMNISAGSKFPIELASIAVTIFRIGSVGTERIWYLRSFQGEAMQPGLVWSLSWRFVRPYLRLGLVVFGPLFVYVLATSLAVGGAALRSGASATLSLPAWFFASTSALVILADFVLTFATAAVAYTTRSAWEALRINWQTITRFWPASAAYVLFPPLAILLVSQANPQPLNLSLTLLYLRHHDGLTFGNCPAPPRIGVSGEDGGSASGC